MHKLMYRFVATTKKKIPDPNLDTVALWAFRVISLETFKASGNRNIITRDALKGHTVSKNGSISFYARCPEWAYRV